MRMKCPHCDSYALIKCRINLSHDTYDSYCACRSEDCKAEFVIRSTHSHDTKPPRDGRVMSLVNKLAKLSDSPEALERLASELQIEEFEKAVNMALAAKT